MVIRKTSKRKVTPSKEVCSCCATSCHCGHHGYYGIPLFLIVFGLLWLAKNYGWIGADFWPYLLIVFGLLVIVKHALIFRKK
jgi:hypothetical protein